MIDTEFYGFDPEQKIHLLRPNYNKNINYDIDLIDHISFYSKVANKLELDGFLEELENELDVYLYWGDDYVFDIDYCLKFKNYLIKKLNRTDLDPDLVDIYTQMLNITNKAIELNSGLYIDFF